MERIELELASRETLGKKVRFLRHQGITPVHLFGHGIESLALQCETAQLKQVLSQAGRTKLIDIKLDRKKPRKAVVREVRRSPKTSELLHVDFYQVRMEEKIRVEVPIVLTGESPALKLKENMLEQYLTSLTVECLPDEIPADIELDLSPLAEIDDVIRVKDIDLGEKVTVLNEPEMSVVKISMRPVEKVEEEVVEEEIEEEAAEEALAEESPAKEAKEE
ncbi:MAG: 50S ribosomal protein L25 [Dehalococcoidia bacterium]|nr:MAG: 50S ribosomal protein L25 [Dehalococcoidia bacterium]